MPHLLEPTVCDCRWVAFCDKLEGIYKKKCYVFSSPCSRFIGMGGCLLSALKSILGERVLILTRGLLQDSLLGAGGRRGPARGQRESWAVFLLLLEGPLLSVTGLCAHDFINKTGPGSTEMQVVGSLSETLLPLLFWAPLSASPRGLDIS